MFETFEKIIETINAIDSVFAAGIIVYAILKNSIHTMVTLKNLTVIFCDGT